MNRAPHPLQEKRAAVSYATQQGLSHRRACALVTLNRSTACYKAHGSDDAALVAKIAAIQAGQPRFGVRRVFVRLCKQGEEVNHKRVQRVMHVYGLQVVRRRTKKTIRTGASVPSKAEYPNHVWTVDFQEDALMGGRKLRILNILDEFTREWLAVVVGASASAKTVTGALLPLFQERGSSPVFVRSDNGGEFIADALKVLLARERAASLFIEPGRPWQNGYIESFHGRLRDELLDRESFLSIEEAQVRLEAHRHWYNRERPHSALGYRCPEEFRQDWERDQKAARPSEDQDATKA
jgi:putative transposase